MTTKRSAAQQVKFFGTKVAMGGSAVAVFLGLWGAVAAGAKPDTSWEPDAAETTEEAPIVQDGWQWDAARGEWVMIEQAEESPPAAPAQAPVVIVERQPVYYVTQYVEVPAAAVARPAGAAGAASQGAPAAAGTPASQGSAGATGPAASPETAPVAEVPVAPEEPPVEAPSAPAAGYAAVLPEPVAPAPAPAPVIPAPAPVAPAPAPAPAPPPPPAPTAPPKPASAPSKSKAS